MMDENENGVVMTLEEGSEITEEMVRILCEFIECKGGKVTPAEFLDKLIKRFPEVFVDSENHMRNREKIQEVLNLDFEMGEEGGKEKVIYFVLPERECA